MVSPHRAKRPWQGKNESVAQPETRDYDSGCYLCPGNKRASGEKNPVYRDTYVFTNDFASLLPDSPAPAIAEFPIENPLLVAEAERGTCRVVCFSPRHDLSMARLPASSIHGIVEAWKSEYESLGSLDYIGYVQIFENKGPIMGCSNPHPHGQIWANESVPALPRIEGAHQLRYRERTAHCLLCDYLAIEELKDERIVVANDSFVALVPYWAVWPYETMILPRSHRGSISELTGGEAADLSDVMRRICVKYDNLFETDFPYSMGIHQTPTDMKKHDEWHMHLHYLPPLLRSATVKKFMVGYEMLAMPQRDITAEVSAEKLRELPERHYLDAPL